MLGNRLVRRAFYVLSDVLPANKPTGQKNTETEAKKQLTWTSQAACKPTESNTLRGNGI